MKKIVFLIVTMAALCGAKAQDTVFWGDRLENYFIYGNCPMNPPVSITMTYPEHGGEMGIYFYTPDSLTIYGIAAALRENTTGSAMDTTGDQSFEYLRLYNQVGDSLQCINQKEVYLHQNVSYYVNFDTVDPPSYSWMIKEMHECYFDNPTTVIETFYVGTTLFLFIPINGIYGLYKSKPFSIARLAGTNINHSEDLIMCHYHTDRPNEWHKYSGKNRFSVIFPILTPDTSLAIDTHNPLDRLTGVMPNPAAETAKVVSSFGISRIEAYNMAGERVHEQRVPDGSLSATLDLRRWPTGAYVLRIHTPQGIATKKLTVRR